MSRATSDNKFPIPGKSFVNFNSSFPTAQGGAYVLIYTDGSVLLHHGGIEMGQGLHTKMMQVCSRALGVPVDKIHTTKTSTETIANTTVTAGSTGADLNGPAIVKACEQINARLKPVKEKNPSESILKKNHSLDLIETKTFSKLFVLMLLSVFPLSLCNVCWHNN